MIVAVYVNYFLTKKTIDFASRMQFNNANRSTFGFYLNYRYNAIAFYAKFYVEMYDSDM